MPELREARAATTSEEREAALAGAEARLGRSLTVGERRVDVVGLDRDLAEGKRRLAAAIDEEKMRAARKLLDLGWGFAWLEPSGAMRERLRELYRAGRDHALAEVRAAKDEARAMSERDPRRVDDLIEALRQRLPEVTVRLQLAGSQLDLGEIARDEALAQLERVPGALAIAADLVSPALAAGLGDVFSENAGLFGSWTYSAVMDGATCEECEALDGETFERWEAIQEVLPDGGPNPSCYGETRCRCRPVPGGD